MGIITRHLNWTYGLGAIIGLIILIYVGFLQNNVIGYIVYISTVGIGGILTLWAKGRLRTYWVYILLWISAGLLFPIAVICLKNKNQNNNGE